MSEPEPIVFVVDDEAAVRTSLELLIESVGWQVQTFPSAQAFLARPRVLAPSCLILDVVLPDLNGCDLQGLLADRIDLPVIFISGHGDVPTTVRAMKGGAVDFLTKPVDSDALLGAIGNALERSRDLLCKAAEARALLESYASLSRREREVMMLVAAGLLNKQVGCELGISEITVKAHRGKMMRKMNADSLAALVRMADQLGIACSRRADATDRPAGLTRNEPRLTTRAGI
jgi:FixJ family two-component response regulator